MTGSVRDSIVISPDDTAANIVLKIICWGGDNLYVKRDTDRFSDRGCDFLSNHCFDKPRAGGDNIEQSKNDMTHAQDVPFKKQWQ